MAQPCEAFKIASGAYDHIGKRVVHIADGRSKASLERFEPYQIAHIKAMAMDMSKAYIAVAEEVLPVPEDMIVFDRFHVMKAMNEALDHRDPLPLRRAEA